jgi:hypothetical protein
MASEVHPGRALALLLALLATIVLALAPTADAATRQVPQGWLGTVIDGPLFPNGKLLQSETQKMVTAGVESVRIPFSWRDIQPARSIDQIPEPLRPFYRVERGVPTTFAHTDQVVRYAALRRFRILPTVLRAPAWAARRDALASPPEGTANYANLMGVLVARYGPNGSFWRENRSLPKMAIREWQIWNEPMHQGFWSDHPWEADYVALARAARAEIKRLDSGAKIVAGGFVHTSWEYLASMLRVPGAKTAFDVIALHPYTREVSDVLRIVRLNRQALDRAGLRRMPIYATEMTWPSSRGRVSRFGYEVTQAQQASRLKAGIRLLARNRRTLRLERVYWYTWLANDRSTTNPFDYAGLRRLTTSGAVASKPSYTTYIQVARELEGCRKGSVATSCR